jgi:Uma2 family endonuclease
MTPWLQRGATLGDAHLPTFTRRAYAMAMPDVARWTRAEVLALPDDGMRHELIDGELIVTPAPRVRHQDGVTALTTILLPYVQEHRLGRFYAVPADLEMLPDQLTQPDLFVVPPGIRFDRWEDAPTPVLVIEVASPSTARYDRGTKRRLYQRAGVPEYWIVDLDARLVERWRPVDTRPEVLDHEITWQPGPDVPPLRIDLDRFFVHVMDEV